MPDFDVNYLQVNTSYAKLCLDDFGLSFTKNQTSSYILWFDTPWPTLNRTQGGLGLGLAPGFHQWPLRLVILTGKTDKTL